MQHCTQLFHTHTHPHAVHTPTTHRAPSCHARQALQYDQQSAHGGSAAFMSGSCFGAGKGQHTPTHTHCTCRLPRPVHDPGAQTHNTHPDSLTRTRQLMVSLQSGPCTTGTKKILASAHSVLQAASKPQGHTPNRSKQTTRCVTRQ